MRPRVLPSSAISVGSWPRRPGSVSPTAFARPSWLQASGLAAPETPWARVFLTVPTGLRHPRSQSPDPGSASPCIAPAPQDSPRVSCPRGNPRSRIPQMRLLTRTGRGPVLPSVCGAGGPRCWPGRPCGQLESPARGEATVPCPRRPQTLRSLGRGDGRARLRLQVRLSRSVVL